MMEALWMLADVLLGVMLWDMHRGTAKIVAIAEDIHRKTDALLRHVPPTP